MPLLSNRPSARSQVGMIPDPLSAIVFDKDGLLLDTESLEREAALSACSAMGFALSEDHYQSLIGYPRDANDARLLSFFGQDFPLPEYHRARRAVMSTLCRKGVPLKPGAAELFAFARQQGIRIAVATSSGRVRAKRDLKGAGLWKHVEVLVSRDDVVCGKPDPETYTRACTRLKTPPCQCLALEDSSVGITASIAAGLPTIAVPDLAPLSSDARRGCVGVLSSLWDVRDTLKLALAQRDTRSPSPRRRGVLSHPVV